MKYIEVNEALIPPNATTPAGLYVHSGSLYIIQGNNGYPVMSPLGGIQIKTGVDAQVGGGIDSATFLRAIAMAVDHGTAKQIMDKL